MASIQILRPTRSNIGSKAVGPIFVAMGTWQGITRIRGRVRKDNSTWTDYVEGIVKHNGRWFIPFKISSVGNHTECRLEVEGIDGNIPVDSAVVPRFGVSARTRELAPTITYPQGTDNDGPFVIEGAERSYFVTEGLTDADILRPKIDDLANQADKDADDWGTINTSEGKIWFAVFEDLEEMEEARLRVANSTTTERSRNVIVV